MVVKAGGSSLSRKFLERVVDPHSLFYIVYIALNWVAAAEARIYSVQYVYIFFFLLSCFLTTILLLFFATREKNPDKSLARSNKSIKGEEMRRRMQANCSKEKLLPSTGWLYVGSKQLIGEAFICHM